MKAFSPFIPMIAHSILAMFSQFLALVIAFCLSAKILWKSKRTIDWMTSIFFLTDLVCFIATRNLTIHLMLTPFFTLAYAILFLASLLGNNPFTAHYAKKQTPKQYWSSPHFLKVNKILTSVFAGTFFLEAILKFARLFYPESLQYPTIFLVLNTFLPLFICWFPRRYKNRAVKTNSVTDTKFKEKVYARSCD